MRYLLDASVIIAFLHQEKSNLSLESVLSTDPQFISAVNLAEIASKLSERGAEIEAITSLTHMLNLTVLPFTEAIAYTTGELRHSTSKLGLSLGDRACLATALNHQLEVLTADKAWLNLSIPNINVHCIR